MPPVLEVVQPQRGLVAAVSLLTPSLLGGKRVAGHVPQQASLHSFRERKRFFAHALIPTPLQRR